MCYRLFFGLLILSVLLSTGGLITSEARADGYLLIGPEQEGTRAFVSEMNAEGDLAFRELLEVAYDSNRVATSPDGRLVVFGRYDPPAHPAMLSAFFVGQDDHISTPTFINNPMKNDGIYYKNYTAFHPSLPLFFSGGAPLASYRYSINEELLEPTSHTIQVNYFWTSHFGYSPYCNSIVFVRALRLGFPSVPYVQTMKVWEDGSFGDLGTSCTLATTPQQVQDFAVSPNGRWAVVATAASPWLHLVRIEADGAATLMQQLDIPQSESTSGNARLIFTPDSKNLILLSGGQYRLSQFEIDEKKGQMIRRSWVDEYAPGWRIVESEKGLAVTPDGRFVAFCSWNPYVSMHTIIHLVQINKDGTLQYQNGKEMDVSMVVSALAFAPRQPRNGANDWAMYE